MNSESKKYSPSEPLDDSENALLSAIVYDKSDQPIPA
jgi:hypothetical protein